MQKIKASGSPVLDFILDKIEVVDMELLRYLISSLPYETEERFIYALAGIYNPIAMLSALPKKSHPYTDNSDTDYSDATLLGYDYLQDRVSFTIRKTQYSAFKTEEDAKAYTETGKRAYEAKWTKTPTEEYPFIGIRVIEDATDSCSYSTWIKYAIVEEQGE